MLFKEIFDIEKLNDYTSMCQDALQAQIVIKKMNEMMDTTNKADITQDFTDASPILEAEKANDVSTCKIFPR